VTSPAIEPYYTEAQVALLLDPSGKHVKARSIRSEREGGRLVGSRIAGKWLYRQSDLLAFLERARTCPAPTSDPASSSAAKPMDGAPSTISVGPSSAAPGGRVRIPTIQRRQSGSSRTGSTRSGGRDAEATVIPLRSELPTS
jgi:hypothetical protein